MSVTLILSTRNNHKVDEIQACLGGDFVWKTLRDFPDAPAIVEDGETFEANALKKSLGLASWLLKEDRFEKGADDVWVMADDSGLEVDALHGAPGVRSARFAVLEGTVGNSPDGANNARLLEKLTGTPMEKRTARFRCVIAITPLVFPEHKASSPVCYSDEMELGSHVFAGACEGRIEFELRGENGFGYDPLFLPEGFACSFAELTTEEKNRISHRAKALAELKRHWKLRYG